MAAVQEETVCRICRETGTEVTQRNPLLSPCLCRGTSGHVHLICLEHWVRASGKDTCSICKAQYSGVIVELSRPNFAEFLLDHHFVGGQNLGLFVGSVAITIGLCLSKDVVGRTTGYLAAWSMFDYLMAEYCDRKLRIKVDLTSTGGQPTKLPTLFLLAGITCDHLTMVNETQFQEYAAEHGVVVVCPDTSPRNTGIPGESNSDIYMGHGASYYLDTTSDKWRPHYQMFSYVTKELFSLLRSHFPFADTERTGICGPSTGGHGSLMMGLKRPDLFKSVSAMSPLSCASNSGRPFQDGAWAEYFGPDKETWKAWDASALLTAYQGPFREFKLTIGSCDPKWVHLQVWEFVKAAGGHPQIKLVLNVEDGYDHDKSFFVKSFIGEHIAYHAKILKALK